MRRSIKNVKDELAKKYRIKEMQDSFKSDKKRLEDIKIIGITGSKGKSSTAYMVHEYLKAKGYKSILASSIGIDSPVSFKGFGAVENPLYNEEMLFDLLNEAENYGADYLVLEVNERAIEKGLIANIPFRIRALTNIIPTHSMFYGKEKYVDLKKSFFKDIDSDEDVVYGLTLGVTKDLFEELLALNNNKKTLYGFDYAVFKRNLEKEAFAFLGKASHSLNGIEIDVRSNSGSFFLETNLVMPFHVENILCALSILQALNELDMELFSKVISRIRIPGREEVFRYANKTVILSIALCPQLEVLKSYQPNKLTVISGAEGLDFESFIKEFSEEVYQSEKMASMELAFDYQKKYADKIILTTNDNGSLNALKFLEFQQSLLKDSPSQIISDRKEAIKSAIFEAVEGEVIYISGRGNRRKFLKSFTEIELWSDKEIIEATIKEYLEEKKTSSEDKIIIDAKISEHQEKRAEMIRRAQSKFSSWEETKPKSKDREDITENQNNQKNSIWQDLLDMKEEKKYGND